MSQSTILPIDCVTAICYNLSATLVTTIKTGTFVTFKGWFFFYYHYHTNIHRFFYCVLT